MTLNPLSLIEKLINEHGSSAILRERLLLIKDELCKIEKENIDLKAELSASKKEKAQLRGQLGNKTVTDQFVEHNGMLFKRKTSGGYHRAVFCPACRLPMSALEDWMSPDCVKCSIVAPFSGHDLPQILKEVENENR